MREHRATASPDSTRVTPQTTCDVMDERIEAMTAWLKENGPECTKEQAHLDAGSREQLYWNYGYLMALRDIRNLLSDKASVN